MNIGPLNLLIISDGKTHSANPCVAFAEMLYDYRPTMVQQIIAHARSSLWVRLCQRLSFGSFFNWSIIRLGYQLAASVPRHDLIVCADPQSLVIAAAIAKKMQTKVCYIGQLERFNSELVHSVVTVLPQPDISSHQMILPTPPVDSRIRALQKHPARVPAQTALLILGISTPLYQFDGGDWELMIRHFAATCEENNLYGTVCTTQKPLNAALYQLIDSLGLTAIPHDAITNVSFAELIGHQDVIFMTEDQHHLIAEAIQSTRAVVTLYPRQYNKLNLIEHYERHRYIMRCSLEQPVYWIAAPTLAHELSARSEFEYYVTLL